MSIKKIILRTHIKFVPNNHFLISKGFHNNLIKVHWPDCVKNNVELRNNFCGIFKKKKSDFVK